MVFCIETVFVLHPYRLRSAVFMPKTAMSRTLEMDFDIPFDLKHDLVYCQRALTDYMIVHQVRLIATFVIYCLLYESIKRMLQFFFVGAWMHYFVRCGK